MNPVNPVTGIYITFIFLYARASFIRIILYTIFYKSYRKRVHRVHTITWLPLGGNALDDILVADALVFKHAADGLRKHVGHAELLHLGTMTWKKAIKHQ